MKILLCVLMLIVSFSRFAATDSSCPLHEQHQKAAKTSPYAGQQNLAIKSLSPEDVAKYLAGEGMGLARAAELNHYPGPKHVLELAKDLSLQPDQEKTAKAIFEQMHNRAVELGNDLVEKERELDQEFASATITEPRMMELLNEIAELQSKLRHTHLSAHLKMKPLLNADQLAKYDDLRGYGESKQSNHNH